MDRSLGLDLLANSCNTVDLQRLAKVSPVSLRVETQSYAHKALPGLRLATRNDSHQFALLSATALVGSISRGIKILHYTTNSCTTLLLHNLATDFTDFTCRYPSQLGDIEDVQQMGVLRCDARKEVLDLKANKSLSVAIPSQHHFVGNVQTDTGYARSKEVHGNRIALAVIAHEHLFRIDQVRKVL